MRGCIVFRGYYISAGLSSFGKWYDFGELTFCWVYHFAWLCNFREFTFRRGRPYIILCVGNFGEFTIFAELCNFAGLHNIAGL